MTQKADQMQRLRPIKIANGVLEAHPYLEAVGATKQKRRVSPCPDKSLDTLQTAKACPNSTLKVFEGNKGMDTPQRSVVCWPAEAYVFPALTVTVTGCF